MKKNLLIALATCITPLPAEEAEVGFQGALPQDSNWQNIGSISVESVDEGGVKALSFVDESESEFPSIVYPLTADLADRMRDQGYTLDIRLKHVLDGNPSGNFMINLRLPGLSPLQIAPYGQDSKTRLFLSVSDFASQKNVNLATAASEDFLSLRVIYRPDTSTGGGTCEVIFADDKSTTVTVGASEKSPRASIEIGGRGGTTADRMGRTFVESLKLSIP